MMPSNPRKCRSVVTAKFCPMILMMVVPPSLRKIVRFPSSLLAKMSMNAKQVHVVLTPLVATQLDHLIARATPVSSEKAFNATTSTNVWPVTNATIMLPALTHTVDTAAPATLDTKVTDSAVPT